MLLVAATLVLWFALREPDGWTTSGGERQGWSVEVPPGWTTQVFSNDRWCEFLGYRDAVIVTEGDFEFHSPRPGEPNECLGRFILAGFPRDEVAFAVQPYGVRIGILQPSCIAPPIALADLEHAGNEDGPVKVRFSYACPEGDDPSPTHVVRGWIGRDASPASRELLERVLASFRFLRAPSDVS
jgi:hypothetical protein